MYVTAFREMLLNFGAIHLNCVDFERLLFHKITRWIKKWLFGSVVFSFLCSYSTQWLRNDRYFHHIYKLEMWRQFLLCILNYAISDVLPSWLGAINTIIQYIRVIHVNQCTTIRGIYSKKTDIIRNYVRRPIRRW